MYISTFHWILKVQCHKEKSINIMYMVYYPIYLHVENKHYTCNRFILMCIWKSNMLYGLFCNSHINSNYIQPHPLRPSGSDWLKLTLKILALKYLILRQRRCSMCNSMIICVTVNIQCFFFLRNSCQWTLADRIFKLSVLLNKIVMHIKRVCALDWWLITKYIY